jgi:hypothetical protein
MLNQKVFDHQDSIRKDILSRDWSDPLPKDSPLEWDELLEILEFKTFKQDSTEKFYPEVESTLKKLLSTAARLPTSASSTTSQDTSEPPANTSTDLKPWEEDVSQLPSFASENFPTTQSNLQTHGIGGYTALTTTFHESTNILPRSERCRPLSDLLEIGSHCTNTNTDEVDLRPFDDLLPNIDPNASSNRRRNADATWSRIVSLARQHEFGSGSSSPRPSSPLLGRQEYTDDDDDDGYDGCHTPYLPGPVQLTHWLSRLHFDSE